jgi:hypothetical protein
LEICYRWHPWFGIPLTLIRTVHKQSVDAVRRVTILATGPPTRDDFCVYYSGVTILLTILSAYLILWPGKRPDWQKNRAPEN